MKENLPTKNVPLPQENLNAATQNEELKSFKAFEGHSGKILKDAELVFNEISLLINEAQKEGLSAEKRGKIRESLNTMKKAGGKFSKFVFLRVLPAYMAYFGIAELKEKPDGKFSEREQARKELKTSGITSQQQSGYRFGMSEMLYRGIVPWGYQNSESSSVSNLDAIEHFPGRVLLGREGMSKEEGGAISPAREDAWRLMLGLPQEHDTFGISDYKPENSRDDKFYFKINGFEKKLFSNHFLENEKWNELGTKPGNNQLLEKLQKGWFKEDKTKYSKLDSLEYSNLDKHKVPLPESLLELVAVIKSNGGKIVHTDTEGDMSVSIMGHYKLSCSQDEKGSYISYYDTWDLDNTFMGLGNHLTRAYEIYDRIYYDPHTGKVIEGLLSK